MYDVVAIGELLIDFAPGGLTAEGTALFERNPGGAPGNVLAILAKLGKKTALISKVGEDQFGEFLISVIDEIGIDKRGIVVTNEANTTLAFVHLDSKGDRSFSFYRKPGADMLLSEKEVDLELIYDTKIFHFGTVSMTHEPCRGATLHAVKTAKETGALISYDPNLRPPLWNSLEEAKEIIELGLEYADILKVSNEELEFITGIKDLEEGSNYILDKYGIKLILVTLGPKGCFYRLGSETGRLDTYDVPTVDTTGAGDAFWGALLYQIIEKNKALTELSKSDMEYMVDFANAAGSLATMRKGAIPAMPSIAAIEECIKNVGKLIMP
jgi:fructokinase